MTQYIAVNGMWQVSLKMAYLFGDFLFCDIKNLNNGNSSYLIFWEKFLKYWKKCHLSRRNQNIKQLYIAVNE